MCILRKVEKTIQDYDMLRYGDTVVVGVSGGADSTMLLDCLIQLKDKYNLYIKVAHINHLIRVGAAEVDADFVKGLCVKYGVEFHLKEANIPKLAKEWGVGEEEAGRKVRYDFFKKLAGEKGKIVTAHNANDNVETVLMRFMRGTGVTGLGGIPYKNNQIIRPILDITRYEIEEYLRERGLMHITDSTNFEPIYTRNKIRLNLIPKIQEEFNPNFLATVSSNIQSYREDADYFAREVDRVYKELNLSEDDGSYSCYFKDIKSLHPSMGKRVIYKIITNLMGEKQINISARKIDDIYRNERKTGDSISLSDDYRVRWAYDMVYFEKVPKSEKDNEVYEIDILSLLKSRTHFMFVLDKQIAIQAVETEMDEIDNQPNCFYIPYEEYANKVLTLRTCRENDKFRVEDGVHKKLNRFFCDKKVDSEVREDIMLICDEDEVLCALGVCATRFKKRKGKFVRIIVDGDFYVDTMQVVK